MMFICEYICPVDLFFTDTYICVTFYTSDRGSGGEMRNLEFEEIGKLLL